jgi:hypothetical protein
MGLPQEKLLHSTKSMKTNNILRHSTSRLSLLLAATISLSSAALAQHAVPTTVASYVPAKAAAGETVYANLFEAPFSGTTPAFVFAHAALKNAAGGLLVVPVTYEAPLIISFKVPVGAVTEDVMLFPENRIGQQQIELPIVALNKRLPGIVLLNKSQFNITRVKQGQTSLLPLGRLVPAGQVGMIERVLPLTALSLEVGYSESNVTRFTTTEVITGVTGLLPAVARLTRRETLKFDPFTVTEVLSMGAGNASSWSIQANEVTSFTQMFISVDGGIRLFLPRGIDVNLTIDEASAQFSAAGIKFRVCENGVLVGPALIVTPPYDVFATNQIGPVVARARQGEAAVPFLFRRQF